MRTLDKLFNPESIAVVGASNNRDKVGYQIFHALRKFPGQLFPINAKAPEIQGVKAYSNFKDIGQPIDVAVFCIPAGACLDSIKEAGEAGVAAALITGGGFGETGGPGQKLQDEIVAACRQHDIRLLGPNTAGFFNPGQRVTANFAPMVSDFSPGTIAIVSQSGAMSVVIGAMLESCGLGVSIGVGIGNGADIAAPEVLEYLAGHRGTNAIAVYLEGVMDGRRQYEAITKVTKIKPVVVYTVGKSDIGEFAVSHTGKMVGSFALKKAALVQAGAVVVSSSTELVDAVHALSKVRLPPHPSPGVGLLTGQAGPAIIMTDYLRSRSVSIPELETASVEAIAGELPLRTHIKNPVDTARPDQQSFEKVLAILAADPAIDLLLTYTMHEPMCVQPLQLFRSLKGTTEKPLLFGTAGTPDDIGPVMRGAEAMGIPAYAAPERAATAVRAIIEDARAAWRKQRQPVSGDRKTTVVKEITAEPDEAEAKQILEHLDLAAPPGRICGNHAEAMAAFSVLKKPLVLKMVSAGLTHKTEIGGVHLDICSQSQLVQALEKIDAIDWPKRKRYLLEEMAPEGLDIIIGAKNDDSFGPSVLLGLGGVAAEALGDFSLRLAPLTIRDGLEMIGELRGAALFDAYRGGPVYNRQEVAAALVRIGSFMGEHPEVREMDLNPVRVYEERIIVLDALIICNKRG